jgi:hypothetical protein
MAMEAKTSLDQVAAFRQSLAETIAWCTLRATLADPQRCLRTAALQPQPLYGKQSVAEQQACVASVIHTRSHLLRAAGRQPRTPAADLAAGRLLLFDPDVTLSDGAAAVSSQQFFDDDNVPPWDCRVLYVADPLTQEQRMVEQTRGRRSGRWSALPPVPEQDYPRMAFPYYVVDPMPWRESYLVSWAAPPLIPLAHSGVVVNPESCIEWLADRQTPCTQALQTLHLLAERP